MTLFTEELKSNWPKAFKYFLDYYHLHFNTCIVESDFQKLPFEYQVGIYVSFFHHINSDIQFYSTDMSVLQESIKEAFQTYEEYLFLDS